MIVGLAVECCRHGRNSSLLVDVPLILSTDNTRKIPGRMLEPPDVAILRLLKCIRTSWHYQYSRQSWLLVKSCALPVFYMEGLGLDRRKQVSSKLIYLQWGTKKPVGIRQEIAPELNSDSMAT